MTLKRRRSLSPPRTAGANRKEARVMYRVNLSQFIENGPAVLAERARIARLSAHKFELLKGSPDSKPQRCPLELAA